MYVRRVGGQYSVTRRLTTLNTGDCGSSFPPLPDPHLTGEFMRCRTVRPIVQARYSGSAEQCTDKAAGTVKRHPQPTWQRVDNAFWPSSSAPPSSVKLQWHYCIESRSRFQAKPLGWILLHPTRPEGQSLELGLYSYFSPQLFKFFVFLPNFSNLLDGRIVFRV